MDLPPPPSSYVLTLPEEETGTAVDEDPYLNSDLDDSDSSLEDEYYEKMQDLSNKRLKVNWNLKFVNGRKEDLFWKDCHDNASLNYTMAMLFLFFIVRFLSLIIDSWKVVELSELPQKSIDCSDCVQNVCKVASGIKDEKTTLPKPLDSRKRVAPNYRIIPFQMSNFPSDNVCPSDIKYEMIKPWIDTLDADGDEEFIRHLERLSDSRGCNFLMTGHQPSAEPFNEDIATFGIFLVILVSQVVVSIWRYVKRPVIGYSYVEEEQDKTRQRIREFITNKSYKNNKNKKYRGGRGKDWSGIFDVNRHSSADSQLIKHKDHRLSRIFRVQMFLSYTAYFLSIILALTQMKGSSRFGGGLLENKECPEGEFDLNYASLYEKGLNSGMVEAVFLWSRHGLKYILGIGAFHFTGVVRFATLLPISVMCLCVTLAVFMSTRVSAELRTAFVIIPLCHYKFLSIQYRIEYTQRLMWDIERKLHKETTRQRKVCEDMLPKTALSSLGAILKDSLDLACRNDHVTFLFSDIVGFTNFSDKVESSQVLQLLQSLFVHFDFMVSYYGLFKVCTIGDAYLAITQPTNALGRKQRNVTQEDIEGFAAILQFGYTMIKRVMDVKKSLNIIIKGKFNANGVPEKADLSQLAIRIGLNHGTCVGGIIGSGRIRYDIWGMDVLMGEVMEQNGVPNEIHVSETWKNFFNSYPVTSFLATHHIEDAGEFPMRDIRFKYRGVNKLKLDEPTNKRPTSKRHGLESHAKASHMKGYILNPSWSDMVQRMRTGDKYQDKQRHKEVLELPQLNVNRPVSD